jgi:hypothetical protein
MRFSYRDRTTRRGERGYVLISAIALAILYFALMELMLIDSSRALKEAQRFRSRIMASTLAESAAELAAAQMVTTKASTTVSAKDDQGNMTGELKIVNDDFELIGQAETVGVQPVKADVRVQGRLKGTKIVIDYTFHSQ